MNASTSYDLKRPRAPRLTGATLRAVAWLSERSLSGALLSRKLLRDAGITAMRDVPAEEPLPVGPPNLARGVRPSASPDALAAGAALEAAAALPAPEQADFPLETAADFVAAYTAGRSDPERVVERLLAAVEASERGDRPLRVFIAQDAGDLRAQAKASAERYRNGTPLGPLDGVPIAVKDELDQSPFPTTVGTRFLGTTPAAADAEVVARLRAAGALLVGKTNMHEIGLGVTGVNPHHGAARNPYDPDRVTGGSSSGPAAAVAAGFCPIAVGADGGGSIRLPAALCGVVGLKATFGRVSEHGAAPLCWSVAHVGPLAASVRDLAVAYSVMAGPHDADPNTQGQPAVHLDGLGSTDLSDLRLGVFRPWFDDATDAVREPCDRMLDGLRKAGATVVPIELPELELLRVVHLVTIISEMTTAHLRYRNSHRTAYGADTRLNLSLARSLSASDYGHAQRHRVRLCEHFERALRDVDAIVTPATGCTAPPIRPDALAHGESDLVTTSELMRFMPAANLTGHPAISFPAGYDEAGLPVGFQAIGRSWEEHTLLRIALVAEGLVERRRPRAHQPLLAAPSAVEPPTADPPEASPAR